jgi:hypothetical protein
MPPVGFEPTIPVFERAKTVHVLDRAATAIGALLTTHKEIPTNFLLLYSLIQALAASMKLSASLQLLDLGQTVGLLGRVISSSQGLFYLYRNTEKRTHNTNTKHPCPE